MTVREAYIALLVELNKVQAPSLLLSDFIYLFNKGVQQYFNKRYNLFEKNQQLTDDLRALTKTVALTNPISSEGRAVFDNSLKFELPENYVHILNCICEFQDLNAKCQPNSYFQQGANKLDTNQWSTIIANYYMRPSVKQPYYYIINIDEVEPTSYTSINEYKEAGHRYGNSYKPVMEIKCGSDPNYKLIKVYVDYLRAPQYITLTKEQLDNVEDTTEILEFPDYVIYEIIDQITELILENGSDPRLQTHIPINTSIPQN